MKRCFKGRYVACAYSNENERDINKMCKEGKKNVLLNLLWYIPTLLEAPSHE